MYKGRNWEAKQLRTPGKAGFQLLDLHDFPGQGLAPVGVLDAFWDSKGYVTPAQYRRFCNQTVPLARMNARLFTNDQPCEIGIDVAHFGATDLSNCVADWRIRTDRGEIIAKGQLGPQTIKTGGLTSLGKIAVPIDHIVEASKLNLEVALEGTEFANDWDFWVYPAKIDPTIPDGISVIDDLNDGAIASLNAGGKALLLIDPARVAADTLGSFEPIFWNRVTFPTQKQHTLGVLCDPKHPAFASFPTDAYTNWQWWDIQQHCKPMVLDSLPRQIKPIVQMIDDWNVCRKLALAFEVKVGAGKLIVCSIDMTHDLDQRLASRQLKRSLLNYMASDAFAPAIAADPKQIQAMFTPPNQNEPQMNR